MAKISRRQFLKASATVTAAAAAGVGYSYAVEPNLLLHASYDLASARWPKNAPPLRAAFAGDFHVGCLSVDIARVEDIVSRLNARKPDVIFLLGDFLTNARTSGTYVPPEPVAAALKSLKAPGGVFAVLGNHDWHKDGRGMWRALEKAGIQVLENDAARVKTLGHDFWVAGLADDTSRNPDIKGTLSKITTADPFILLMHDPGTFLDKPDGAIVSLAGHMHGGQVRIPFIGMTAMPAGRAPKRFGYGHIVEEGRDLIVTSGIGTSNMPVRFNAPPELGTLIIRPSP